MQILPCFAPAAPRAERENLTFIHENPVKCIGEAGWQNFGT